MKNKIDNKSARPLVTLGLTLSGLLMCASAQALDHKSFAGISFVKIEPGCFDMGRDKDMKGSTDAELPRHHVCIKKPYYLGETEVTQKQWESIMGNNPSKSKGQSKPVEKVSWEDVQTYITQLNNKEGGNHFRLPTEAEWEYAARAGSTKMFSFGDDPKDLAKYAWFGDEGYGGSSHDVAQKPANAWGLYDMHGNVWEWVQDWYSPTYYSSSPGEDPSGPESGQYRAYRGGSWVAKPVTSRSAARYSGLPSSRTNDLGFRLARDYP